ncbi:unnamed protein product [Dibothriocephalus latus]|uniref:Essential MCU regulator, mitochondrial n=1 Tax=Dibothriocephalus latus TaxID=60516 RepID=A0A3P6T3X6_DIBLA|nr:unnamed protein product [Dibothriocephalus latus]
MIAAAHCHKCCPPDCLGGAFHLFTVFLLFTMLWGTLQSANSVKVREAHKRIMLLNHPDRDENLLYLRYPFSDLHVCPFLQASGALRERPILGRYGIIKSLAVALPLIYIGAMISMNGAAYLEEHDIFVPEDDEEV